MIVNWCLWDGASDKDRLLTWEMVEWLPKLYMQDYQIYEYNQWDSLDCTIYSALWALSDLYNREVTQKQIDEAVEESYKRWRVKGQWWYVKEAIEMSCKLWKLRFWECPVFYRINNNDDYKIQTCLEHLYTLCTSYNGSRDYNRDRDDNGQIDKVDHWEKTYWHAVNLRKTEKRERAVKDNYKWRKTNIYGLIPLISELKKSWTWQYNSYLIVKSEDEDREDIERLNKMKNMIDKMITSTEESIAMNSEMRHKTNDKAYQESLHATNDQLRLILISHKQKKEDIERELSKYFIS